MSGLVDELDVNPFFIALQTLYQDKYELAQEKCFLVCVPQASSIQGVVLTPRFVDFHILRPSPYFQSEYLTTHPGSKVSVKYEDGSSVLSVHGVVQGAGEDGDTTIRIVSEELAYNKAYKQFKILIIERPVDASFKQRNARPAPSEETAPPPVTASFIECREYLKSSRLCEQAMAELDKAVIQFLNNYLLLPNFLEHASTRLQDMCSTALEACLGVRAVQKNPQLKECLPRLLESYVLGTVHHKLWPVVCQRQGEEDRLLARQCSTAAALSPAVLGIRPQFCCPMPLAVRELSRLAELQTPQEKMLCVKSAVDRVLQAVREHCVETDSLQMKHLGQQEAVEPHLTSDDLLPILVWVIAQTDCLHLASEVLFMEQFGSLASSTDRDDLGYCLVTFKAALEFLKQADWASLSSTTAPPSSSKEEDSVTEEVQASVLACHTDARNPSLQRMQRQLENISLMTRDAALQEQADTPLLSIFPGAGSLTPSRASPRPAEEKSKELGDFLAALDDDFDLAFGKQT